MKEREKVYPVVEGDKARAGWVKGWAWQPVVEEEEEEAKVRLGGTGRGRLAARVEWATPKSASLDAASPAAKRASCSPGRFHFLLAAPRSSSSRPCEASISRALF